MNTFVHCVWRIGLPLFLVAFLGYQAVTATAVENEEAVTPAKKQIAVEKWLVLGPLACPLPAFNEEGETKTGPTELLEFKHMNNEELIPLDGTAVPLIDGTCATWTEVNAGTLGIAISADSKLSRVAYLATYIEVPRWMEIDIEGRGTHAFEVKIDGLSIVEDNSGTDMEEKSGTAKLERGKHLLIAKTVYVPEEGDTLAEWRFDVRLAIGEEFGADPALSTDPARRMTIEDVLEVKAIQDVKVCPDGEYVALSMSKRRPPEGKSQHWLEIRRFKDGRVINMFEDMSNASQWQWMPMGHRLSYVATKDEAASVRVIDIDTGSIETVVENIKDFGGYDWSPDGTYIVYSITTKPKKNDTGVKRLQGAYDRRHYERDRSSLYVSSVPLGITRWLTAGEHSTFTYDIHPDGRSMLIGRTYEDLAERPYSRVELIRLSLDAQTTEILWTGHGLRSAKWSPDGQKILAMAAPSSFGDIGHDVPEGTLPNDYDTQAYIFDPETKTAEPITKDFDPAIVAAFWPKPGGDVFFVAEEGEYVKFYRYTVKKGTFRAIDLECDVIRRRDVARDKPVAVVTGSGARDPARAYAVDLKSGKTWVLRDPSAEQFEHVTLGRVEDWNFKTTSGKEIVGRVHYPPDFDPGKKWPCIVYYYGGTSPVGRSFGGRYPKNLWAAYGYVVYVLQPSGATGFGQAFSALHVNDWGKLVSGEIIEGAEKFIKAQDFVDPARVGCIGASFGGFMTQLLVTKTDVFAAAISHAGISSITSYWGEGYWGYEYNAVSAANSFPWNRPDIYVDQSPLFSADKINTPLLLLHGTADTNVPPGESEQMYTALKLLGREVEYLRVEGQNHFVLDYKKRITWSDAILAWFDKWLKGEPQWWDDMYPPLEGATDQEPAEMGLDGVGRDG